MSSHPESSDYVNIDVEASREAARRRGLRVAQWVHSIENVDVRPQVSAYPGILTGCASPDACQRTRTCRTAQTRAYAVWLARNACAWARLYGYVPPGRVV